MDQKKVYLPCRKGICLLQVEQLNVTPADCKQMSIVFQLSRREGI